MDPRPAMENLCCQNPECKAYGQRGQANLTLRKTYGVDRIRYLRCQDCGEEFSERRGAALFNCKLREAQAVSVIEHLDSQCGMNATGRLVGVSKTAVRRFLQATVRVSHQLHDALVRPRHAQALQFGGKWSYVWKQPGGLATADQREDQGDHLDANDLDPQRKLPRRSDRHGTRPTPVSRCGYSPGCMAWPLLRVALSSAVGHRTGG